MSAEQKVSSHKRGTRTEVQELVAAFIRVYAAERVLPQSAVEFRYAESAPKGATLAEKEPSSFFGRPVGAGGVGRQEVADPVSQLFTPFYGCLTPTSVWANYVCSGLIQENE
jgi:hypothetical protein